MKSNFLLSFTVLCLVMAACSTNKSTEDATEAKQFETAEAQTSEAASATAVSQSNTVKLKGLYATSLMMPHAKFGAENLFDGNDQTFWATMPGAGPDEGVMLYFYEPVNIQKIYIRQPASGSFSKINSVTVYANGQVIENNAAIEGGSLTLNAENVLSFFIRLSQLDKIEYVNTEEFTISNFPADVSAAISALELYDANGKLDLIVPQKVKGTITASSTLEPALSYGARNLFDARKEFVWVEGAPGPGENQFLKVAFETEQEISGLRVMNGFQRSDKHFTSNARAKRIAVAGEGGAALEVDVSDEQGEQFIQLASPLKGKQFTLTVKAVYPGTAYKDMVLSELKFTDSKGEFILEDNATEKLKSELISKAKGTVLESYLDRRVLNDAESEYDNFVRSLILRSDYTFVAYLENSSSDGSTESKTELIADGNWELKSLGQGEAKIRIFGKLVRLSETVDYYAGNDTQELIKIFQDNLTLTESSVAGEKYIEKIQRVADEVQ